ncbi:4-hydroxy-tetrahydrodipicolinate reductase [Gryllotalpicola sp.]|uniref:4-hydroxy-tetrahydrodipicolinate reductase n=1 Tax=Gryllotalpicola sp. TaxID=1932787 RepID=UPI0026373FF2|nr:4-hydroxy-tetrahydrodipicolinate reductase [Gryllotalpicola sp.]
MTIRVAVVGATGKLGSAAATLLRATEGIEVVAELRSGSALDEMLGTADSPSDVVLDATSSAASPAIVEYAVANGRDVVAGSSGWTQQRLGTLRTLLEAHPERGVLVIPNFSLGAVLGTLFSAYAARFFDAVEIVETHGAGKSDSPSGTAIRTAESIEAARGDLGPVEAPHADQRARGQLVASVPVHSLRLPGVVAQQRVVFGGDGETLTISHETVSSSAYSKGIVAAVRAAPTATGLVVGLDRVLGLDLGHRS